MQADLEAIEAARTRGRLLALSVDGRLLDARRCVYVRAGGSRWVGSTWCLGVYYYVEPRWWH